MSLKHKYFNARDRLRLKYAKMFYEYIPQGNEQDFSFDTVKHVVILKVDGKLGDTEVMSHFYQTLQEQTGEHKIYLTAVCHKNLVPIYKDILHFDQVIEVSRKPKKPEIYRICQQIATFNAQNGLYKIDLVVNNEPNSRPRDFIFYYYLKPDYVAGFDSKVRSVNLLIPDLSNPQLKIAQCFCRLMDKGNLTYKPIKYSVFATKQDLEQAKVYLNMTNEQQVVIGINPYSSSDSRSFSQKITLALIKQVLSYKEQYPNLKIRVMLLCPPNEQELTNKVKQEFNSADVCFLPSGSSIINYAASISVLSALITVDTAAVHIAEASDVPMIAFYTGVNYEDRWIPVGKNSQFVRYIGTATSDLQNEQVIKPCQEFLERYFATKDTQKDN